MGEHLILPGDPPIALDIRPSARARRLSLRVSRLDGRVTLTLPKGASRRHALSFVEDKADWIRRHLADRPDAEVPMPGGLLPFRGTDHPVVTGAGRSVRLVGGRIEVPHRDPERTPARLMAFLKHEARAALAEAALRSRLRLVRTIVGSEDDQGAAVDLELGEQIEDASRAGVELLDDVGVEAVRRAAFAIFRGIERAVRKRVRQVEQERPLAVGADEVERALGIALG